MSTTIEAGWLKDSEGNKFAPKTMSSQILNDDGTLLKDSINIQIDNVRNTLNTKAPAEGVAYIDDDDNETVMLTGDLPDVEGVSF